MKQSSRALDALQNLSQNRHPVTGNRISGTRAIGINHASDIDNNETGKTNSESSTHYDIGANYDTGTDYDIDTNYENIVNYDISQSGINLNSDQLPDDEIDVISAVSLTLDIVLRSHDEKIEALERQIAMLNNNLKHCHQRIQSLEESLAITNKTLTS
jgi:hypothetical protein